MEDLVLKLKTACNQFYLNKDLDKQPLMSDEEFDKLREEYELKTGNSVKLLVDWESDISIENEPEDPLNKSVVEDNDLESAIVDWQSDFNELDSQKFYLNLKYDGGGIKLVYDSCGRLQRIQSTPDEEFGLLRTEQFWDLVPHQLDPKLGIKCIRGEVLVDPEQYGKLARNKANGLINSTVNQDEIKREAFIRVYKLTYFDNEWSVERQIKDLDSLPTIILDRTRVGHELIKDTVFAPALRFSYKDCPTEALVKQSNGDYFQADGVVLYSNLGIHGFKFYYTDYQITTVKNIAWNKQSSGSFAAVMILDPIELDDKTICKASSNGVPKMIRDRYGIGAKVKVILANTTIPKIVEVLEPSDEFRFPKCGCGYQMSEKDIFGSTLKCGNKGVCIEKYDKWYKEFAEWMYYDEKFKDTCHSMKECIQLCPEWFGYILHIDRWDPLDKFSPEFNDSYSKEDYSNQLLTAIESNDVSMFISWIERGYTMSELQYSNMEVNAATGLTILNDLFYKSWEQIHDIVESE